MQGVKVSFTSQMFTLPVAVVQSYQEISATLIESIQQTDAALGKELDSLFNLLCVPPMNVSGSAVVVECHWDSKAKSFQWFNYINGLSVTYRDLVLNRSRHPQLALLPTWVLLFVRYLPQNESSENKQHGECGSLSLDARRLHVSYIQTIVLRRLRPQQWTTLHTKRCTLRHLSNHLLACYVDVRNQDLGVVPKLKVQTLPSQHQSSNH